MPEPRTHAEHRPWFESILRKLPGFRGYLEKEYRREADGLQREWLTERLARSKRALDDRSRAFVDAGEIDLLPEIDRVRLQLERLMGRIDGAVHGYSGFFDFVQIDEAVLEQVYQYEVDLMVDVDKLAEAIESLPQEAHRIRPALAEVRTQLDAAGRAWDRREDMLKGIN